MTEKLGRRMNQPVAKKTVRIAPNSRQIPYHFTNLSGTFLNAEQVVPTAEQNKKTNLNTIVSFNQEKKEAYFSENEPTNQYNQSKAYRYQQGLISGELRGYNESPSNYGIRIHREVEGVNNTISNNEEQPLQAPSRAKSLGRRICNAFGRCFRKKKVGGTRRKCRSNRKTRRISK